MKEEIPLLEFNLSKKSIIEPTDIFKKIKNVPSKCVLCFFQSIINKWEKEGKLKKMIKIPLDETEKWIYEMEINNQRIVVMHPGVGAPLAAINFEYAISIGCTDFIAIGSGGVLDPDLEVGKLVLLDGAIRDEGVSYHYLEATREVKGDARCISFINRELTKLNADFIQGKSWTTSALFRETHEKIRMRRKEGAVIVEMEAAALMAVSIFRDVHLGYIVYCSDDISDNKWDSRRKLDTAKLREDSVALAIEICSHFVLE